VGVALEDAAVHERPGIALVRVADHVLLGGGRLGHGGPFEAARVAGAPAAAEPALDHRVDHVLGRHLAKHGVQGAVAFGLDVRLDALRVDLPAVGQHDGMLFLEEGVAGVTPLYGRLGALGRRDQRGGVLRRHVLVQDAGRIDSDQGPLAAQPHAADAAHLYLVAKPRVLHRLLQPALHGLGIGGHAAGRHAAADHRLLVGGALLLCYLDEVVDDHG